MQQRNTGCVAKRLGKKVCACACARAGARVSPRRQSSSSRASQPRLLEVDDLEVWVTRKRIKNVNLRVKPPYGRIEISVPMGTSDSFIGALVREKREWILDCMARIQTSPRSQAAEATPAEIARWKAVVQAFAPALIEKWEPVLGVKAGKVAYRNMKSRWGSCQPATGRICINVRLALYPPECLEYVVVHELCHLIEQNHGPRFKALLDACLPDWRAARDKLR